MESVADGIIHISPGYYGLGVGAYEPFFPAAFLAMAHKYVFRSQVMRTSVERINE
jgi:hypothetical protein